MKHYLHNSLRALFLSLAVLLSLPMLAEEVEIDGIRYDLDAETKQAAVVAKSSGEYSGEVVIPESVEYGGGTYDVTSIGSWAFCNSTDLTSVTIGNRVDSIGNFAFRDCFGLTSITIPNSVTIIGKEAFRNDSCLTELTIGDRVMSIGTQAFDHCSGLNSVTIPNSVRIVGEEAFRYCYALTSITIGSSVENIGEDAFATFSQLLDVYCYAENVPSTEDDAFDGIDGEKATLHVPAASIDSYKATRPWSGFGKIVALTPEETGITETEIGNVKSENSAVYDLSGRRVQKAQKGIFIQNGKVVVK